VSSRPDRRSNLLGFKFQDARCAQAVLHAPGMDVYAPALARMRDSRVMSVPMLLQGGI
jgi:hypothetical protein